jgi:spoIIIJ-associated protein
MEWVETTGSTLEEARDRALDQLGVDQQEAEFQTVAEPKTGLFGRLKEEARVRARVRPKAPPAKEERRDRGRRRGGSGGGRDGGQGGRNRGKDRGRGRGGEGSGKSDQSRDSGGGQKKPRADDRGKTPKTDRSGPAAGGRRGERESSANDGGGRGKRREAMDDDSRDEEMPIEEQKELLIDFFESVVDEFGLSDATVTATEKDEDILEASVEGSGVGILIGPDGATMGALEEIARTIVQRQADHRRYARIRVDVGSYRARRNVALEKFAQQLADKVLETGEEVVAEPMSSLDRKVIHDAIVDVDGVETRSVGEEPRRRVVVAPAD